jgi:uncharacterized membrane protein YjgN (DUF898 family)
MAARHVTQPEPTSRSDDALRISRSTTPIRHGWPAPPAPRLSSDGDPWSAQPVHFDGGAGSYLGVSIVSFLITALSLGLLFPLAYVRRLRWRIDHTLIEGRRMRFTGTGRGLFGFWLRCWILMVITLGIYGFWVRPQLERWACDHTVLAPAVG